MPFPFSLPTTSSFAFSSSIESSSHPSLPLNASTQRGVVRDTLKKHKRIPSSSQASVLPLVASSLTEYIPYLLAVESGLSSGRLASGDGISISIKKPPKIEWRPTLSGDFVPGRERGRVKIGTFGNEAFFTLSTLAFCHVLLARSSLQPLYDISSEFLGLQQRSSAITTASKYLVDAASIWNYVAGQYDKVPEALSCVDVSPATAKAMASLAHAEATLLAVLKDDPYPTAVAQSRNKSDKEWMFKSPDMPKVRAHLFARLSLAASEHAAKAASLCQSAGANKFSPGLLRYIEDIRRASRAKACRFFGIDADLGGNTAEGIGWLNAGLQELGVEAKDPKKGLSLSRWRKDFTEKREDRRVEKESDWGADGGKMDETRVIEMLSAKWNKVNDTMNTKHIPPTNSLLSKMPSGRDIHTIKPYEPPVLDKDIVEVMRAPPDREEDPLDYLSSDEEPADGPYAPAGAFPGAEGDYGRSTPGNTYY